MRLSASQIQTFKDCQRKWAWKYVAGIEEPPKPEAELGKAVHKQLEIYLGGGALDYTVETGYIAAAGLEHLPKQGTAGLRIEQEFHFEGPSGHSYLGYKDLEVPGIIYDHKTTKDLVWQKTPDDLKTDVQAILYAVDYFRNNPKEKDVELRWIYYQTKNTRKSAVTRVRVNQEEVWSRFLDIEKIAGEIEAVADKQPLDLPSTIKHCSAYGGCPHQGRCNLSPSDKMRSYMAQNKLLQSLQQKKSELVPAAFAPGGAFHGTQAGNKLLAKLQANGAPAPAAINPPEYQPPHIVARAVPQSVPAAQAELAASLSSPVPLPVPTPEPEGRGRPRKAVVPETGVVTKIKTLYINCGPVGVAVTDANDFIVRAKKRLLGEGLADYRFAEYGQGPGMLTVAAAAELDALEGVVSAVRLDTTTPEGQVVAVELVARAGVVVR